ncbi:MAG: PfkB family carbohydrate kinase [Granulosicoccaceae bacterium]|jgi:ketohexokinase
MARVLATGVATIDLVQVVDRYPREDEECRARDQYLWRGGNATNSLVVLSQFGHDCQWLGTLADDALSAVIRRDLDRYRIDYTACPVHPAAVTPTSHITLNQHNGSRTILHYRDLPELSLAQTDIELAQIDWLHVEGRNVEVTRRMLQRVRERYPALRISLEIEKPRDAIESLLPYVDHVLFSRAWARAKGYDSAGDVLAAYAPSQASRIHVCAWGELGAWARHADGRVVHSPAWAPPRVLDTRAAGDVFNAAWIHACLAGEEIAPALQFACGLAGMKCGQLGLDGLSAALR